MAARARQGTVAAALPAGGTWRRIDPRARLLATLCVSAVLLAASRWPLFAAGFAALFALHAASRTPPGAAPRPS